MTFTGRQKISVSWRKDGKLIWASYQYNVETSDCSCRLDVLNSDREEASGRYTCEISNSEGSDVCHANVMLGNVSKHAPEAEALCSLTHAVCTSSVVDPFSSSAWNHEGFQGLLTLLLLVPVMLECMFSVSQKVSVT